MKRWLALLSAVVGGAIAGLIVGSAIMLGLYSLLWVFVFGDNTWPSWVMPALDAAYPLLCVALWVLFGWGIWTRLTFTREAR